MRPTAAAHAVAVAAAALVLFTQPVAWASELSPEAQLALQHLRDGERARLEKAQGSLAELPLYRLQLEIDPVKRKVTGRAQVLYTARARTLDALHLRVTPNAQGPRVRLSYATVNGRPVMLDQPEPTLFRVRLDPPVPVGASVQLEVRVQAELPELPAQKAGLLSSLMQPSAGTTGPRDYGAFAASEDVLMLTGILPMVPPSDAKGQPWPGPSGLGDLALFEPSLVVASLVVPAGHHALASGVALGEVPEKDGRVRFSWAAAGVRDFPVIVTRGYEKQTTQVNGIEVESWHTPSRAAAAKRATAHAVAAISEMEKRLGPLPHRVFRVVEAPLTSGAGGMEFSGLIVISRALYEATQDPGTAMGLPPGFDQMMGVAGGAAGALGGAPGAAPGGAPRRTPAPPAPQSPMASIGRMLEDTLELTVAHEVAHQYFAGLVGSDPVGDPVVDEALAQYAALLYFEWKHGRPTAQRLRREQLVGPYHFYRMGGGADGSAARSTASFSGSSEYAALVYGKAPLLLDAQRKLVGDASFFKGLRAYVDAYRWGWACVDCFTQTLGKVRPERAKALEALRAHWWEEANGDEDLGAPDFAKLVESMTGQKLDPETAALLRQLLPQLTGQ